MNKLHKEKILENLPENRVNITIYDEIDSTNDEAKRMHLDKEFEVLVANKQTNGRGRQGKKWSSPDSGNIYMTICTENDLSFAPASLIAGLVCINSISQLNDFIELGLKWPNDIFIKGRKVGGILAESRSSSEGFRAVLGIGINMIGTNKKMDFPLASLDELASIPIEQFHLRLHAELSSLIEEREDLPPVNYSQLRDDVLFHLRKFGKPILDGNMFNDFTLNKDGELVLSDGHIVKDGEDISWH